MKQPYHFYATVLPGMESIAVQELQQLAAHEVREAQGSVHFSGTMDTLYRVSLRSRTLTRILLRVGKCQAMSYEALQQHISEMNWEPWLTRDMSIKVHASAEHSKLFHTEHIETSVLAGIRDALPKPSQNSTEVTQTVHIHIRNNRCDVRIDTSGERLDRRGYRIQTVAAPIRETLAAGLLQWMQWDAAQALHVPMCGSGTFAIEAAQMGQGMAANSTHQFPFLTWASFKPKRWQRIMDKTQAMMQSESRVQIMASDMNPKAVQATKNNAKQAKVLDMIQVETQDVRHFSPEGDGGLVICNPPYGVRLEHEDASFYSMLGKRLKALEGDWKVMVICPSWKHERALGMSVRRKLKFRHGGLWLEALDVSRTSSIAWAVKASEDSGENAN